MWTPWRSGLREPTILTMLRAAAADADRLGAVAPAPPLAESRRALAAPHSSLSRVDVLYGAVRPSAPTAVPGPAPPGSRRAEVTQLASVRRTYR
jgi:hypothetical protein